MFSYTYTYICVFAMLKYQILNNYILVLHNLSQIWVVFFFFINLCWGNYCGVIHGAFPFDSKYYFTEPQVWHEGREQHFNRKKNSITDCKQGWLVVHWMHCDIEIIYWKGLMKRNKWIRSIVATAIHKRASISIGNHQCDGIKTRQEANLSTWKTQLYVTLDFFKT